MSVEMIKAKHLPLAACLVLVSCLAARSLGRARVEEVRSMYAAVSYCGVFFLVAFAAMGLQCLENRYLWSRFLNLDDNLSFMGLSVGAGIGLMSLGLW